MAPGFDLFRRCHMSHHSGAWYGILVLSLPDLLAYLVHIYCHECLVIPCACDIVSPSTPIDSSPILKGYIEWTTAQGVRPQLIILDQAVDHHNGFRCAAVGCSCIPMAHCYQSQTISSSSSSWPTVVAHNRKRARYAYSKALANLSAMVQTIRYVSNLV